jgi:hypothetical protein
VHDVAEYEANAVPAVFVASEEFVSATTAQAAALGTDPAVVYVAHPIQDRTDEELHAIAEGVVDEVLAAITAG